LFIGSITALASSAAAMKEVMVTCRVVLLMFAIRHMCRALD
jgi:hypothetical protein